MKDTIKQIVIFGDDFNISFDSINQLSEIQKKYEMKMDATQDLEGLINANPYSPNIIMSQEMKLRPVLKNDKEVTVYFGQKRIHIEQKNEESVNFDKFSEMALDIIENIITKFKLKINRLAVNGQLIIEDQENGKDNFKQFFKESQLYGDSSDEWQFRVVSKEENAKISETINKIICYTKIKQSYNSTKGVLETKPLIYISYDYNTLPNSTKNFTFDELKVFYELAKAYRQEIIK